MRQRSTARCFRFENGLFKGTECRLDECGPDAAHVQTSPEQHMSSSHAFVYAGHQISLPQLESVYALRSMGHDASAGTSTERG